jgi:uncharacterized protein
LTAWLASGCGSTSHARAGRDPVRWIDQPVTFTAGGMTIHGTFRHPTGSGRIPAALLIAGSGPTDRNGDSGEQPGSINTLKTVADWLSADGVASLRYDKLGSGQTGLGPYAADPSAIGVRPFEEEAVGGLNFLAHQADVNPMRLAVLGHSEGALFALMVATGAAGPAPAVRALGLLEPLSLRSLSLLGSQLRSQLARAQSTGELTSVQADQLDATVAETIQSIRSSGQVPTGLPSAIANVFSPVNAMFMSQVDRFDPAVLAARLPARTPVLITCSNADIQVTCPEVARVVAGLAQAHTSTNFVRLAGVDHVLKVDASRDPANYVAARPFSPQLREALRAFVAQAL